MGHLIRSDEVALMQSLETDNQKYEQGVPAGVEVLGSGLSSRPMEVLLEGEAIILSSEVKSTIEVARLCPPIDISPSSSTTMTSLKEALAFPLAFDEGSDLGVCRSRVKRFNGASLTSFLGRNGLNALSKSDLGGAKNVSLGAYLQGH